MRYCDVACRLWVRVCAVRCSMFAVLYRQSAGIQKRSRRRRRRASQGVTIPTCSLSFSFSSLFATATVAAAGDIYIRPLRCASLCVSFLPFLFSLFPYFSPDLYANNPFQVSSFVLLAFFFSLSLISFPVLVFSRILPCPCPCPCLVASDV